MLQIGDSYQEEITFTQEMEQKFKKVGVRVVYFPYTKGTSSTLINKTLNKLRDK